MPDMADIILRLQEIAAAKRRLASTDYKVVKCYEYSMMGLEMPYDIKELHKEREALRVQIRSLSQTDE